MQICPSDKCTGCAACQNICKHNCISMQNDNYGELHPVVDDISCKQCGLCIKTCPVNSPPKFNYPLQCYASWITDNGKRKICASGGIGTVMEEFVVKNGGVIFGSRYNENLNPIMTHTEQLDDLQKFKGSRYVQSVVGHDTYKNVLSYLKEKRKVLFVGTPCQIAGMKSFLKKDYDNLVTADLICHGVCPTSYFTEEVRHVLESKKLQGITDIRFRGNDGKNYCFSFWKNNRKNNSCEYIERGYSSYYLGGFLLGVTLRENCFSCSYARPERISDITIGDFIGLGKKVRFDYHTNNVSAVLINTEKGKNFYGDMTTLTPELINIEREYSERLEYKESLVRPFPRHPLNVDFRKQYLENGWIKASRLVLKSSVRQANIKRIITIPRRAVGKIWRIVKKRFR